MKHKLYFKFMSGIAKKIFPRPEYVFEEVPDENEPAVYLCNHSGAIGPAYMSLYFDKPKITWIINYMFNTKKNIKFIQHDFFFINSRKCKPFWRALSFIVAKMLKPLLDNIPHIEVYRDSKMLDMFKNSLEALKNGQNIVIFPECPKRYNKYFNEIYSGFTELGKMYQTTTGKQLKFYPCYACHPLHKLMVGKPITYDPTIPMKEQRTVIANYIRDNVIRLAESLPEHEPSPFLPDLWYKSYGQYEENTLDYWKLFN